MLKFFFVTCNTGPVQKQNHFWTLSGVQQNTDSVLQSHMEVLTIIRIRITLKSRPSWMISSFILEIEFTDRVLPDRETTSHWSSLDMALNLFLRFFSNSLFFRIFRNFFFLSEWKATWRLCLHELIADEREEARVLTGADWPIEIELSQSETRKVPNDLKRAHDS